MLSPTSLVASQSQQPFVPGHRSRTSSVFSLFSNGQGPPTSRSAGVGLGLGTPLPEEDEVDPDMPLPTLEVQPSMLAVDLSLGPGESRTCEFIFDDEVVLIQTLFRYIHPGPAGEPTANIPRACTQVLIPVYPGCLPCRVGSFRDWAIEQ